MKQRPIQGDMIPQITRALSQSPLFRTMDPALIKQLVSHGMAVKFEPGQSLMREGDKPDAFYVILRGSGSVQITPDGSAQPIEVNTVAESEILGEMGIIRRAPRSATIVASEPLLAARFDQSVLIKLFDNVPGFGVSVAASLAERLQKVYDELPQSGAGANSGASESTLPPSFMSAHRVTIVRHEGQEVTVGSVDKPTPELMEQLAAHLPGKQLKIVAITPAALKEALGKAGSSEGFKRPQGTVSVMDAGSIEPLLRRMVSRGASDLHLCGGQSPHWRIDGEILPVEDLKTLSDTDVFSLLKPVMSERALEEFERLNDTDFAHPVPGLARFRVNVFRDHGGVGAVLRTIPDKILSAEQLNLSPSILRFCEMPKGLVLVTGPTGSGKSTTLAAMIDYINRKHNKHIITLEDPVEFVHTSKRSLVNHREVGTHTESFTRALRAALRQDPDIVLVGELRDLETINLAMETANTGHLVFGTLHTATAVGTIERMINVFPSSEWSQVRAALADSLKGVVAQTLCKRMDRGRVAAMEILTINYAMQNMIRSDQTHQIASAMSTGTRFGNQLLNVELAKLVEAGIVDFEEALSRALDKTDLAKRCRRAPPVLD